MKGPYQSWVTLASNDTEAWTSLVLAKSLRRTATTRKLTIVISESISPELKHVLTEEFDFVHKVEAADLKLWNCSKQLLKLWSWNLKGWDKCVFVDPKTLILRNCDDLFDYGEGSTVPKENGDGFDQTLFVFRPSPKTFTELVKIAQQIGETKGKELNALQSYFEKWTISTDLHLDTNVYSRADTAKKHGAAKLVIFDQEPWKVLNGHESFEKMWIQVYYQDVLELVNKETKPHLKTALTKSLASVGLPVDTKTGEKIQRTVSPPEELLDSIAVIGMSCRFPGSNSISEYWDFLCSGQDGITNFPTDRPKSSTFITDEYYKIVKAGFLKCPIDEFDCKFFGISPREAELMDPQQRVLLEVAWESLEAAGVNPHSLLGTKTGVFVGVWQQEYDRMFVPVLFPMHYKQLGNSYGATASRISYFLGLLGPNIAVESGCSSSLAALHLACESLRNGESTIGIAGGVNIFQIMPTPEFNKTLAPDFHCKTFDESANGFGRAEGCGVLVLKRFADAWANGDNILGTIRGSAVNNDGASNSFGTPYAPGQESAARAALKRAGVHASEISYVECHGTGTPVGDPIEFSALSKVYGVGKDARPQPMFLSSVKTNIGHAESAAGIAGVIKVILAMQNQALPPHLNLKNINPKIDLATIPARIPTQVTPWDSDRRVAAVSAFSLSGNNAHMILQESVSSPLDGTTRHPNNYVTQLVTLSAKNAEALASLRTKYVEYCKNHPEASLADLAYTANCGRAAFPHRMTVVASTSKGVLEIAQKLETGNFDKTILPNNPEKISPKIGFLFTGQGSQYVGMAADLFQSSLAFRAAYHKCNRIFKARLNVELQDTWNNSELLAKTLYAQPAIFCLQYCLLSVWAELGVKPDYVLGHSLGEFAAVVAAGILPLESALNLLLERSVLIDGHVKVGGMLALKKSHAVVTSLIAKFNKGWIDVAAINSPEEVVVSAEPDTIEMFEKFCTTEGVKTQALSATHAFHSRAMDPILAKYGKIAENLKYTKNENCTYISGGKSAIIKAGDFNPAYWQTHVREPVNFAKAVEFVTNNCTVLIEIGPHPILLPLAMSNTNSFSLLCCPTLRRSEENSLTLCSSLSKLYLAGVEIDWKAWHGEGHRKIADLPLYPFQRQKFWFTDAADEELGAGTTKSASTTFGKIVHPIIGSKIPSPLSGTTSTYYNPVLTATNKLSWVADHKVGSTVLFPAAGYLEAIMAAGVHNILGESGTSSTSTVPLCVENFNIQAALDLSATCGIQTILTKDGTVGEELKIAVHRQISSDKWKSHAEGSFRVYPKQSVTTARPVINLAEVKGRMRILSQGQHDEALYTRLSNLGYDFGAKFQSIGQLWLSEQECLAEVKVNDLIGDNDKDSSYICHPILIDSMLQTAAVHKVVTSASAGATLLLPVGAAKYVWLGKGTTLVASSKIYCHGTFGETVGVTLYSETGEALAFMEGMEYMATSVQAFLKALRADAVGVELPGFYEMNWRTVLGVNRGRHDLKGSFTLATESTAKTAHAVDEVGRMDFSFEKTIERLSFLYIASALQECGWEWVVGKPLDVATWREKLPQAMRGFKLVEGYLEIFTALGFLRNGVPSKVLPTVSDCDREIQAISEGFLKLYPEEDATFKFVTKCGQNLTEVLQGTKTGLSVLFPPNSAGEFSVHEFYARSRFMQPNLKVIRGVFEDTVKNCAKGKNVIRILEVGAGTGAATTEVLAALKESGHNFEYTFTDISAYFLEEGKKRFGSGEQFDYKILNLEEDPLAQGFSPNSFDIVIGCNVVHATKDLSQSLQNIRILMREGGALILGELFKSYSYLVLSFGLVEGWWRFEDTKTRVNTPLVDPATWEVLLLKSRFTHVRSVVHSNGGTGCMVATSAPTKLAFPTKLSGDKPTWLIFGDGTDVGTNIRSQLKRYGRSDIYVHVTSEGQFKQISGDEFSLNPTDPKNFLKLFETVPKISAIEGILYLSTKMDDNTSVNIQNIQHATCGGLLFLCQAITNVFDAQAVKPKVICVTRGVHYTAGDVSGSGDPNSATLWGVLKVFLNENPSYRSKLIDLDQREATALVSNSTEAEELFSQLWISGGVTDKHFLAIREGKLLVQRVTLPTTPPPPPVLEYPNTPRFEFSSGADGVLNDLQLVPASAPVNLKPGEVEVAVRATSLNFRDLLVILKPDGFSYGGNVQPCVGLDFSGEVVAIGNSVTKFKIGDAVYGYTENGALASHAVAPEIFLVHKPPHMTFSSAAAIPGVFLTSYVSLMSIAKMTADDRVLIHVAAGGVGLAAVQVAKHVGATIYATAGSARKRNYLRSLGVHHVYNSRNTAYGAEIEKDTNGKGVTIVLNSLTSENFKETTMASCAKGARWVEIAKINIWSEEEVKALRPDVKYVIFDLSLMARENPKEVGPLLDKLSGYFAQGVYADLPRTVFAFEQLKEALGFFQEAKHIGKIVIKMPERVNDTLRNHYFNKQSTYLITGGLGGIGMEMSGWMLKGGAKYIVLVGRSKPNLATVTEINRLNAEFDAKIIVINADVGKLSEVERVLQEIRSLQGYPPLRGIMHAAGCLSDGVIASQTWEKFTQVFSSKVYSAWALHSLTLTYDLEFFVMFSSMATVLGTHAQANHSAANAYLDSLAKYRYSLGLPMTTINWGAWSEIGAAAGLIDKYMHEITPFSPTQGIAALEKIVRQKIKHVMVGDVVSWERIRQFYNLGEFVSEVKVLDHSGLTSAAPSAEPELNLVLEMKNCTQKEVGVKIAEHVEKTLRLILRIPTHEQLGEDTSFFDLGMDSLMFMEFRNILQKSLGGAKVLTLAGLQENKTVRLVSKYIVHLMYSETDVAAEEQKFPDSAMIDAMKALKQMK